MVGALSFFGVEIPTYPALGAAARPGPYQHTPARRVGVEAPHTYIPRRAAWVWKHRIPTYPPCGDIRSNRSLWRTYLGNSTGRMAVHLFNPHLRRVFAHERHGRSEADAM